MPFPGAIYMDASKPWPIPPESLDAILCEHMIEHVPKSTAKFVLSEAAKSLRSGCPIRLVTPSLNSFAEMALSPSSERAKKYRDFYQSRNPGESSVCDVVNSIFYEYGHRYIFSAEELRTILLEVGFKDIVESRPGTAIASVFVDKEGHPALLGEEVNAIEAFALEATKI
jgi:predicted SAM-dependent methyltransferase